MRQKYLIIQDPAAKKFKIREYAIIEKNLNNTKTSMLRDDDYSLLYEAIYDSVNIEDSIARGKKTLVATLRTPAFFPVEHQAGVIAESLIELYQSGGENTREIFFDDRDGTVVPGESMPHPLTLME